MNERIVRCPDIEMWKFQYRKDGRQFGSRYRIIVFCRNDKNIKYLLAWAIVCCFLLGPSTTSMSVTNNGPTPIHVQL